MSCEKKTNPDERKPYEPPRLYTVPLAAEEVLAVGCKMSTPRTGPYQNVCLTNRCAGPGS